MTVFWSKMQTVKAAVGLVIGVCLVYAWQSGAIASLVDVLDQKNIAQWVEQAGLWGPFIVIGLMTLAVVASPIPSAPIAIAAGAAYGHYLGTVYIVAGAFTGAMVAFSLSRWLGHSTIRKWFGNAIDKGLLGSQNALTATVFLSRILPFVSFDMISYAAGLSTIYAWRFALATLLGVFPTAFLMAHLGEMAIESDSDLAQWFSVALGAVVALTALGLSYKKLRSILA